MFRIFKRNKNKPETKGSRRHGIPTAGEIPRIASTVTTRLSDGTPIPPPVPQPVPEPLHALQPESPPPLPGPDQTHPCAPEVTARFAGKSPDELCGIEPSMGEDEIRARLAKLFLRHNRAASSFDLNLRAEAEIMLQAIVAVREQHLERL
jgi:hypothetical protein